MIDRYYICGTYGNVRIFDRKHQKYVSGTSFPNEAEAEEFLSTLDIPPSFAKFLKEEGNE